MNAAVYRPGAKVYTSVKARGKGTAAKGKPRGGGCLDAKKPCQAVKPDRAGK
jgi:hypothetical protein